MIHLITGGSASGKSVFAEQTVISLDADVRYYIATMQPWGEEGRLRVEKHRAMRAGKGFRTIECYHHLPQLDLPGYEPGQGESPLKERTAVLLECMSNLVANEQFETGGTDEEIRVRIRNGILHLQKQAGHIIIVTNEVFSDGCDYDSETMRYLELLGCVNQELAAMADRVTEVVYGIPVVLKSCGRNGRDMETGGAGTWNRSIWSQKI